MTNVPTDNDWHPAHLVILKDGGFVLCMPEDLDEVAQKYSGQLPDPPRCSDVVWNWNAGQPILKQSDGQVIHISMDSGTSGQMKPA